MFEQVYARMGGELPGITRWIIDFSKNFPTYLLIVISIVIVLVGYFWLNGKSDSTRSFLSRLVLKIPLAGELIRKNIRHVSVSYSTCCVVPKFLYCRESGC